MITNAWLSFRIIVYDILFYLHGLGYRMCCSLHMNFIPIVNQGTYLRNKANYHINKREDILEEQHELICRRNKK